MESFMVFLYIMALGYNSIPIYFVYYWLFLFGTNTSLWKKSQEIVQRVVVKFLARKTVQPY